MVISRWHGAHVPACLSVSEVIGISRQISAAEQSEFGRIQSRLVNDWLSGLEKVVVVWSEGVLVKVEPLRACNRLADVEPISVRDLLVDLVRHAPQNILDLLYFLGCGTLCAVRITDVHHDQGEIVVSLINEAGEEF